jgi:ABC-type branched-subunit amino acid transport system ATPase component
VWFKAAALTAGYGRITVIRDVHLQAERGEIVSMIGPNGAGKSTVLRAIAGEILPRKGRVTFQGEDITPLLPAQKGKRGIIFIPQGDNIFPALSVFENLEVAAYLLEDRTLFRSRLEEAIVTFPWMEAVLMPPARELSGGQRQMLALCRVVLLRPTLVLLDEPSLGLAPLMVEEVFREIQEMNRRGLLPAGGAERQKGPLHLTPGICAGDGKKHAPGNRSGAAQGPPGGKALSGG